MIAWPIVISGILLLLVGLFGAMDAGWRTKDKWLTLMFFGVGLFIAGLFYGALFEGWFSP